MATLLNGCGKAGVGFSKNNYSDWMPFANCQLPFANCKLLNDFVEAD